MLLVAALFAVLAGCTWVKLTPEGEQVRVLALTEASQCERIGRIRSHTKESVARVNRSDEKVNEELEGLARNEAARMGGNAIAPLGPEAEGEQEFAIYRCPTG
jgi:hypothetical protein